MEKLTESEIRRRMIEWRNLKVLHKKAVARNDKLKRKLENAGIEISALKQIVREQAEMIEVLRLQVEELKQMVFGRKKKKDDDDDNLFNPKKEKKKPKKRNKDSYKRPTPDATDITAHKHHVLETSCPDCGSNLENKETGEFYEEDITLPDKKTKLKQVIKHYVEKGYCPSCRKWHTAFPLPYANVVLGNKIKLYISYLSILLRLSFSQIRSLLWDTYHFKISDGEIAKVLHKSADKLKPAFEKLRKKLQTSKGVHLDETTDHTQISLKKRLTDV